MAEKAILEKEKKEPLLLGGMARWGGLDLFGPNYMSAAYRKDAEIFVHIERVKVWKPKDPALERVLRWPILRSLLLWGRLLIQVAGSLWTLVYFGASIAALWALSRLLEAGSGLGSVGGILGFLAEFPIIPLLILFFLAMRFTSIGRYHGAEHKAVAAYEKYGEVTIENAKSCSRIHPRCGTNILIYILIAALLDPFINWWGYSILQFILISEAWFTLGKTRPSIAVGNFLQRFCTTTEPGRTELEVAVESLKRLLEAEEGNRPVGGKPARIPARF